ncbi:hypothetical protein AZE42_08953 [Rhizopogon vesiculosus]|uniref:Uncharacterized protein n=1 Tax=Rhizopogon vesiculosus TaxID=180088 RepID=A0A1J8PSN0_9AGAM|nr:hypothetical protein AZE42_08953 [Rhizopogon vesiculosus]
MTILTRSLNCLDEFLASYPSGVGMGEEDAYFSRLDFQAIPDEHADPSLSQKPTPQRIQPALGQFLEQEYGPLLQESVVVNNTSLRQRSPGMVRYICILPQTLTTCDDKTYSLVPPGMLTIRSTRLRLTHAVRCRLFTNNRVLGLRSPARRKCDVPGLDVQRPSGRMDALAM